jgi:hypothetical protein
MEKGFPRQALLMTIVRDHNDQGHAILTVKTNSGDFILDNLTEKLNLGRRPVIASSSVNRKRIRMCGSLSKILKS